MRHIFLCLAFIACTPASRPGPPEPVSAVSVIFKPDGRFFDAPFPSAARQRDDGTLVVADFPTRDNAVVKKLIDALEHQGEGLGRSSGFWFPLTGAIDPTTLPRTPAASASFDSAVYLLNLDDGTFTPCEVQLKLAIESYSPANLLVGVPSQGHLMKPGSWYAAVLTRTLKDTVGLSLPAVVDPSAARARLDAALTDDQRANVVAATIFRTADHSPRQRAIATAARAFPLTIDTAPALLSTFPTFTVLQGAVRVPLYQRGLKPYADTGGDFAFNGDGSPVQQADESVGFIVTVPTTPMPAAGYPIVMHVPGSGGTRFALVNRGGIAGAGLARELAARGIATFGVEANLTGPRHPSGDLSGFSFYNPTNPLAVRDNHRQQEAEYQIYARLLATLQLPGGAHFDPASLFLHGHSTGSVVAASILVSNPDVKAGALSGAGGSWLYNLTMKESGSNAELVGQILGYKDGDTVDIFDPVINLAATLWDPVEPMNQAGQWAERAVSVLIFEGIVDTFYLPRMVQALAMAAPADAVGTMLEPGMQSGLSEVNANVVAAPLTGNRADGRATIAVVQHAKNGNSDGHYVVFEKPEAKYQYACFFASAARGVPTVFAPLNDAFAACP